MISWNLFQNVPHSIGINKCGVGKKYVQLKRHKNVMVQEL